ncbi:MAG: response regulator transcription factor [Chloroflexi bacterium]|nr:response regulator transcription factor [Chloroflexota bacterium]
MRLTAKQESVCRLLCLGYRDKEIAAEMRLSASGVRRHVEVLFRKFSQHSRLGLALAYHRNAGRNATGKNDTFSGRRKRAKLRS